LIFLLDPFRVIYSINRSLVATQLADKGCRFFRLPLQTGSVYRPEFSGSEKAWSGI